MFLCSCFKLKFLYLRKTSQCVLNYFCTYWPQTLLTHAQKKEYTCTLPFYAPIKLPHPRKVKCHIWQLSVLKFHCLAEYQLDSSKKSILKLEMTLFLKEKYSLEIKSFLFSAILRHHLGVFLDSKGLFNLRKIKVYT